MSNTIIQIKKSIIPGNVPPFLESGELAINTADGILFYKDPNNVIKSISTGSTSNSFSTINVNSTLLISTTPNDILTISGNNGIAVTGNYINDSILIEGQEASTEQKGVVQLYDGIDSNSIFLAATANAIHKTYSLANAAYNAVNESIVLTTNYKSQEFIATQGQTTFQITGGYTPDYIQVFVNGVLLDTTDYNSTNGSEVILNSGASSGDTISVGKWFFDNSIYLSALQKVDEFIASANQTSFYTTGNYSSGNIKVYQNGILLESSEYTAGGGTQVVLNSPIPSGNVISIEYWGANSINATPVFILANSASSIAYSALEAANTKLNSLEFGEIISKSVTTSTNSANQVLDTFSTSEFRSIKYQIQVDSNTDYQCSELLLIHNGTNSYITEYGLITTNNSLISYETNIISGNVVLLMSPVNNVNSIKLIRTSIVV